MMNMGSRRVEERREDEMRLVREGSPVHSTLLSLAPILQFPTFLLAATFLTRYKISTSNALDLPHVIINSVPTTLSLCSHHSLTLEGPQEP